MTTPVVDPPRFRRLTFEVEWLDPLRDAVKADPIAVILLAEAGIWMEFGAELSYFDSATVPRRPGVTPAQSSTGDVITWLTKLRLPEHLTAPQFARALDTARQDLTRDRSAMLQRLLACTDSEWADAVAGVVAATSLVQDGTSDMSSTLQATSWALEILEAPLDQEEELGHPMPDAWRRGRLTELAVISPRLGERLEELWQVSATLLSALTDSYQSDAVLHAEAESVHEVADAVPPLGVLDRDLATTENERVASTLDPITALESLSDADFSAMIADLLTSEGLVDVQPTPDRDFGADLMAVAGDARTAVQLKRALAPVGVADIGSLLGALAYWQAEHGLMVTTSFLTREAADVARDHGLAFIDRAALRRLLIDRGAAELPRLVVPWPHQAVALESLRKARDQGERRALIEMAPGLGKTYIAALDARQMETQRGSPVTVLYISHQAVILEQARQTFRRVFGDARSYGAFDGSRHELDREFVFATFQSLYLSLDQLDATAFTYVVVDEAHHTLAPTRDAVVSRLDPTFLLGLTATPVRGDGQDVAPYYGDVVAASVPLEQAMAAGLLAPVDYRMLSDELNTDAFQAALRSGINLRELNGELFRPISDEVIIDTVMTEAARIEGQRRILVFCESIAQMDHFAHLFPSARTISGTNTRAEQVKTVDDLRAGAFEVLLSRDVLNEGIDIPHVSTLVFLRNTDSHVVFLQQLGRGLRRIEGKARVDVFDFVNTIPRIERVYRFFSRLDSAQGGASERSELRLGGAASRMRLDATARDVVSALLQRRRASGQVADLSSIGHIIDPNISTATLRRMVARGRLVPDFIVPGSMAMRDVLFESRSVERVMRQVGAPQYAAGLVKDAVLARASGRSLGAIRSAQRRGDLPAVWVHKPPSGRVEYYFERDDVVRLLAG